jgi:hypothetical protein
VGDVVRLEDDPSAFLFQKGDRVARRRDDGAPDREATGVVLTGVRVGARNSGSYGARYEVERPDGLRFLEDEINLARLLDDKQIREQIRERFLTGQLPRSLPAPPLGVLERRETMIINGGRRQPCSACDLIIPMDEVGSLEFHYPTGLTIRFHAACHTLWDDERDRPAFRTRTG